MKPLNIEDYRILAQKRLPRMVFDYLEGGAGDERGVQRNRRAFATIALEPRRLVDVRQRDCSVRLFGRDMSLPFVIAPTGLNGVLWPDGDICLARAAGKAGIPFALSTASNASIEDLAERAGGELWFQLYVIERGLARKLVDRAIAAGYRTLILTVDVPVNGRRQRDVRSGFTLPFRYSAQTVADALLHPAWSARQIRHGLPMLANLATSEAGGVDAQAALLRREMDASFDWEDLSWLRDVWPHTLIVKGIMSSADAGRCGEVGVDGVILSNHGGRQLEDMLAPIEVLPEIAACVRMPLLLDSGIRRGADAVKALALGAQAVLLGRAVLYGLAANGEAGAAHVLAILSAELDNALALIGCPYAANLDPTYCRTGIA